MEEIFAIAINHGLVAAMFVGLVIFVLKETKKREEKYQQTIEKLADTLRSVEVIEETTITLATQLREIRDQLSREKKGGG